MFNVHDLNLTILQTPRADRLLVLPLVQASTSFLVDTEENREIPEKGIVVAIGPGGIAPSSGREIPVLSKVGELAVYGKYSGHKWEITGPDGRPLMIYLMADSEVLLSQPAETLDLEMHDGDPRKIHERGQTCQFCPAPDLERLRAVGRGDDPDAPADLDAAIAAERARGETTLIIEA